MNEILKTAVFDTDSPGALPVRVLNRKLKASFTVESAFIIPLFMFIILALMASGFYARNVILIKASAWKEGIRLEQMTSASPVLTREGIISEDLKEQVVHDAVFMRDVHVFVNTTNKSETSIRVIARPTSKVPLFLTAGFIDITEKIKTNNPAADLRKWHGLQTIMNKEKGKG